MSKYTHIEGLEKLLRVKLLMNYDNKKSLNENYSIISEQVIKIPPAQSDVLKPSNWQSKQMTDSETFEKLKNITYNSGIEPKPPISDNIYNPNNPPKKQDIIWYLPYYSERAKGTLCKKNGCSCSNVGGPFCKSNTAKSDLDKIYQQDHDEWFSSGLKSGTNEIGKWISDPHHFLPIASVVLTLATGGLGGLIVAGVLDAADAALYFKEKDYESAGIAAVCVLIPGAVLLNRIPALKKISSELLTPTLKKLLSKISLSKPLNELEQQILKEIDLNSNLLKSDILKTTLSGQLLKLGYSVANSGLKLLWLINRLTKLGLIGAGFGLTIGGTFYTFGKLANILSGYLENIDPRKDSGKKPSKSDVIKTLEDNKDEMKKTYIDTLQKKIQTFNENDSIQLNKAIQSYGKFLDSLNNTPSETIIDTAFIKDLFNK